jgi:hypothetical protein
MPLRQMPAWPALSLTLRRQVLDSGTCASSPRLSPHQPRISSLAIRRCPLLNGIGYNRHTPVTERSVALHAPRRPKCPRSAAGSKRPTRWWPRTKVLGVTGTLASPQRGSQPLEGASVNASQEVVDLRFGASSLSRRRTGSAGSASISRSNRAANRARTSRAATLRPPAAIALARAV